MTLLPTPSTAGTAARDRLCLALDLSDRDQILSAADELKDLVGWVKLNSAFTAFGPELVRDLQRLDVRIFLDLKLHDIPNTLVGYGRAVTRLGVDLVTVHTAGGVEMMRAFVGSADAAAAELGVTRPRVVGVTLLTSIDQAQLNDELHVPGTVEEEIRRRAGLAVEAGVDGIVCAPPEISLVRPHVPADFLFVTPGTRSPGGDDHDHKRTGTHAEALASGSSLLVVGRRILGSSDPRAAAREVHGEIAEVA